MPQNNTLQLQFNCLQRWNNQRACIELVADCSAFLVC